MIKLSFAQFFNSDFEDLGYELYIVKDVDMVMYIGISRNSVWDRWFGGYGSHMEILSEQSIRGNSTIGDVIKRRLPDSWNWTIELWTNQDCREALREELNGQNAVDIPIITLEGYLIKKLNPLYNVMHANGPHEDPMMSNRLDDEYKKIFDKKSR